MELTPNQKRHRRRTLKMRYNKKNICESIVDYLVSEHKIKVESSHLYARSYTFNNKIKVNCDYIIFIQTDVVEYKIKIITNFMNRVSIDYCYGNHDIILTLYDNCEVKECDNVLAYCTSYVYLLEYDDYFEKQSKEVHKLFKSINQHSINIILHCIYKCSCFEFFANDIHCIYNDALAITNPKKYVHLFCKYDDNEIEEIKRIHEKNKRFISEKYEQSMKILNFPKCLIHIMIEFIA